MSASLVGSEMCIRDRLRRRSRLPTRLLDASVALRMLDLACVRARACVSCLLYTSDAADDM
eukprot:10776434-Alexandrium_andersonii.AAC.1